MLTAADKEKIKKLGIDPDKLIEAVKAEAEVAVEVPTDVTVLKNEDLATRDTNKFNEGKKQGETDGEKKGRELAAKAFKKKFGLDENLPPDVDKVVEAVNTHLAKGDEALKQQVQGLLKDKEQLESTVTSLKTNIETINADNELIRSFPANRIPALREDEILYGVKRDIQFVVENGQRIAKRNGEIVKDPNSHAPLPANKVIEEYFKERNWLSEPTKPGGRGGKDDPPGGGGGSGIKTLSAFTEKWKAENPGGNELSPEFDNALNKHTKDMSDFDFHS